MGGLRLRSAGSSAAIRLRQSAPQKTCEGEPPVETQDAIRARRNVRSYRPDPVPEADLDTIGAAAWLAPSASNRQHRIAIIVTDRDQLKALSKVWRGAGHIANAPAAVALVVPHSEDERTRLVDYFDLGQAMYAMTVAAADLGIGSGHASVGDQDAARAILGVPADHDVAFLLGLGYPADRPLKPLVKPDRLPVDQVVRHGRW
jgi:nitroreductase